MFLFSNSAFLRAPISALLITGSIFVSNSGAYAQTTSNSPLTPFLTEDVGESPRERYDLIAVNRAEFSKTVVELGEIATYPLYTEQLLKVKWRQRDPIEVSIVKPSGVTKPPVVLFLYGYGSDPEKFLNRQFCATLASRGFAAVGFQTALTGPRYHDRPLAKWFVSELPESIGASVHDVQLMIDYLKTRDDLDTTRIGVFGQGSGGAISILAAAADSRITAVDVMNPWGDWPDWLAHSPVVPDEERANYMSPVFLETVKPLDPLLSMHRLDGRPLRLQQTLFDREVPYSVREKMRSALPTSGEFALYVDQPSYIAGVSHDGRMLDWLQAQLGVAHPSLSGLEDTPSEQSNRKPSHMGAVQAETPGGVPNASMLPTFR